MDFDWPPPTTEGQAAAIAAGQTTMWCDWPVLDGRTVLDEHLCVEGWAYCERGLEELVVIVDGERHAADLGLPPGDVDEAISVLDRQLSGFRHVLDTRAWAPGAHDLSVVAVGRDGRAVGQSGVVTRGPDLPYRAWRERRGSVPTAVATSSAEPPPLILCVLKTGAPGGPLAQSLKRQSHRNWRLAAGKLGLTLAEIAREDSPGVIVEDSGFLDPSALARLAAAMKADPPADLVYADEDALAADGGRAGAFFKPGWSPELLVSTDYVGPLVGVGPDAARAVLATAPDPPSTIYDLLLRLADSSLCVERIAEVLFTSQRPRVPCDDYRARTALEALGARRGRKIRITRLARPGTRDVSWDVEGDPVVSVVIPTSYSRGLVKACLRSIREQTTYEYLELVIVDSSTEHLASSEPELAGLEHRVVSHDGELSFSRAVNQAARAARGDYLMLLHDDTEVRSPDWVQRMLAQAQGRGVGMVGCRLISPDERVQHGGVAVQAGMPWHLYLGFPVDAPGYRGMLDLVRNCSAVTGACMLVSSDLFDELGGFDESMGLHFADTDFCLRAVQAGRRVIWTPRAELVHHGRCSVSPRAGCADAERFTGRWSAAYADSDPYYHPAFMPSRDYELRPEAPGEPPEPGTPRRPTASQPDTPAWAPPLSDLEPFGAPPGSDEEIAAAISSGRPAMWCDEPELDAGLASFGFLRVSGWAYSSMGIEVFVYLDGRPHRPRLGMMRDDLLYGLGEELADAGFSVLIDLDAHRSGCLELVVAARRPDGLTVGVRGEVECRPTPPGVRPPEWQPGGEEGSAVPDAGSASGERFVPEGWHGRLIAIEHEARYRWAEGLARDREVLDVACGVGYGTSVLARAGATRALGVDVSPDALDRARKRAGDLEEFVVGDLHNLPCEDHSFDLVTCFETIEHVADPGRGLDELRRVLRPDGLLLLSSPNRDVYIPGNPFHVHEYIPDELEAALSARFAYVRVYRQRNHLASLICGDEIFAVGRLDQQIETDMRKGVAGVAGDELYTLVAASDAPLPRLPSVGVLGEVFDVKAWYDRALAWEERALVAEARAQALKAMESGTKDESARLRALRGGNAGVVVLRRLGRRGLRWSKRVVRALAAIEHDHEGRLAPLCTGERLAALARQIRERVASRPKS
ncbi:MAG: methyltransferase domain-containing protein [Actinomycetota bacterium]|nr:methyltransferase domain-containing protein [Actinomycetota bacterium]